MKKLRITVQGKVYDVTVEVLEDDEAIQSEGLGFGVPPILPPTSPSPPTTSPSVSQNVTKKGGPNSLASPIAGSILKVFVSEGSEIEEKAPVVLMEAMKMETYIYAPKSGKIASVKVKKGDTVQAGDTLIEYA
ncbi:MAG: biotin/lipoyl-binding protein [Acidobacteria bacterium]|nr:biotin/lipoyl-binding protein [Acidobacteriota bacterium]